MNKGQPIWEKIREQVKKAIRSSKLTQQMVEDSKELLDYMGIPSAQAPSEGEAQAAGITNAVNLIDGLDGLSGGITAIVFLFYGLISINLGNEVGTVVSFLLFGATLAFLFYNFPPAKLFMGDSGSLFLGMMAALLPFYSLPAGGALSTGEALSNGGGGNLLPLSATLLIVPILDTFSAILRRKRQGRPFYSPDQNHIHHKLLTLGLSNKSILLVVYGITAVASLSVLWWVKTGSAASLTTIALVWVVTVGFFLFLHRKCREREIPFSKADSSFPNDMKPRRRP